MFWPINIKFLSKNYEAERNPEKQNEKAKLGRRMNVSLMPRGLFQNSFIDCMNLDCPQHCEPTERRKAENDLPPLWEKVNSMANPSGSRVFASPGNN